MKRILISFVVLLATAPAWADTVTMLSVNSNSNPGDANSNYPVVSLNGQYLAFKSDADDLDSLTNSTQIFLVNLQLGTITK